jgi:hypothetical protein
MFELGKVAYVAYAKRMASGVLFEELAYPSQEAWETAANAARMYKKKGPFFTDLPSNIIPDVEFYNDKGEPFDANKDVNWFYKDPVSKMWYEGLPGYSCGFSAIEIPIEHLYPWMASPSKGTINATQREDFKKRMASVDQVVRFLMNGTILVDGELKKEL